jgi:glycoprotein endo-alpha-1,2-mannosidase
VTRRESVLAQIELLRDTYGSHPAWLKANGAPIVFVYSRVADELDQAPVGATGWDDWTWIAAELAPNVPVVMFPLGFSYSPQGAALFGGAFAFAANSGGGSYYTGAHGDDFAWAWTARQKGALLAIPILPSIGRLRTDADEPNYRNQWHAARSVMPDMIIVNSWNEYHESTIIEPTTAFGTRWLDLTSEESALFCRGEIGTLLP